MSMPLFWLVIPAAGIGSRMQADCPKQYLSVSGKTILELTLAIFLEHPACAVLLLRWLSMITGGRS